MSTNIGVVYEAAKRRMPRASRRMSMVQECKRRGEKRRRIIIEQYG